MDNRAENRVQSEPEMLDLVPYGPPWREKGCQFLGGFLMDCWLFVNGVGLLCGPGTLWLCGPGLYLGACLDSWLEGPLLPYSK